VAHLSTRHPAAMGCPIPAERHNVRPQSGFEPVDVSCPASEARRIPAGFSGGAPRTVQGEAVRCRRQVGSHPLTILRVRGHVVGSGGRHCLPPYKTRESRDIQTEMLRPTRKIGPRRDNIVIVRSRSHHPELAFCTIAGQASPYFPRGIGVLTWLTPRKKREHPA